jgi:GNAT superfamily N-acetyltransferase
MRPVNLRTDLSGMADLLELAFGATMDESGRAGVREMRMVSQSLPLSYLYDGVDRLLGGLEQGFVWIEDGKLIGNVSVSPTHFPSDFGQGYIVANVAVHPDFRRHGIAESLMLAALDLIKERGGAFAMLQVDASNDVARRLYTRLGFSEQRTFIRWIRPWNGRPPQKLDPMPFITLRPPNEWRAEFKLAELVRPNQRGGLGWLRPTHPAMFRQSLLQGALNWFTARSEERWIIRREHSREIVASLHGIMSLGGTDKLSLLVHPSQQGVLEEPLLNYALRRLDGRRRTITMEHPEDETNANTVLEKYGFQRRFTLVHMKYEV